MTDPPYYDAVQYAELGELFVVWARAVKPSTAQWKVVRREEAVPGAGNVDRIRYETLLTRILAECARTLKSTGKLVLTFHSSDFKGWASLGRALHASGFVVAGFATAPSDNGVDHAKRGRNVFTSDLVIECSKRNGKTPGHRELGSPNTSEQRELMAAGRVIATSGALNARAITERFARETASMRHRRIIVSGLAQPRGDGSQ